MRRLASLRAMFAPAAACVDVVAAHMDFDRLSLNFWADGRRDGL